MSISFSSDWLFLFTHLLGMILGAGCRAVSIFVIPPRPVSHIVRKQEIRLQGPSSWGSSASRFPGAYHVALEINHQWPHLDCISPSRLLTYGKAIEMSMSCINALRLGRHQIVWCEGCVCEIRAEIEHMTMDIDHFFKLKNKFRTSTVAWTVANCIQRRR